MICLLLFINNYILKLNYNHHIMTKSTLLNIAIFVCRISLGFFIFLFIGLTTIFVHIQIDKNFYKDKEVESNVSEFNYASIGKSKTSNAIDSEVYTIGNIVIGSLYFMYIKYSAILVLLFLSFKEFKKIMLSVKKLSTFKNNNIISFKRIGSFAFLYFLVSSFYFIQFEDGAYSGFTISFGPLIIMLLSFIMAEIFREGNLLLKDNELTI